MRNLLLYMLVTLDGFIAGPDGELAAFDVDAEMMEFANEFFGAADGIMFGRVAYQGFVEYWDALAAGAPPPGSPAPGEQDLEFARIFQGKTRIVFSRTLGRAPANTIVISDNPAEAVARLKREPGGDLLLICGPALLATLAGHRLIDQYHILVCPVALGRGIPLFRDLRDQLPLTLSATRSFASGAVLLSYKPAQNPSS